MLSREELTKLRLLHRDCLPDCGDCDVGKLLPHVAAQEFELSTWRQQFTSTLDNGKEYAMDALEVGKALEDAKARNRIQEALLRRAVEALMRAKRTLEEFSACPSPDECDNDPGHWHDLCAVDVALQAIRDHLLKER